MGIGRDRYLPVNRQDMERRGWDEVDFIFISGDAYVDHPSFANAVIPRVLEKRGYRVGIIAQPDWRNLDDFLVMGRPRLAALVSAGNLDSMLSHFTAAKRPRSDDPYSPGGKAGRKPQRATVVYCNRAREAWKDIPLIIGGVEASLRRFAHYDYWSDSVRRSILVDSKADLLVFGMGERPVIEIADALSAGTPVQEIRDVRGTCYRSKEGGWPSGSAVLPSFADVSNDRRPSRKPSAAIPGAGGSFREAYRAGPQGACCPKNPRHRPLDQMDGHDIRPCLLHPRAPSHPPLYELRRSTRH